MGVKRWGRNTEPQVSIEEYAGNQDEESSRRSWRSMIRSLVPEERLDATLLRKDSAA